MAAVALGSLLVACVLVSALETVVLPRNSFTRITRVTFAVTDRLLIHGGRRPTRSSRWRDLYAPVALVSLPLVWMLSVIVGFGLVFWGVGSGTWQHSFEISGSSVTTLGFSAPTGSGRTWVTFVEAIIGLGLVALLISYLPTIYAAHHAREKGIRTLRPFAGRPASGANLLATLDRFGSLDDPDWWRTASAWLLELDQTHCSFPALCYFPESDGSQSWVASVGSLLDAGALILSASELSLSPDAVPVTHRGPLVVLAYGIPTVVEVGRAVGLPLGPPVPLLQLIAAGSGSGSGEFVDLSVTREEYLDAVDRLHGILGIPDADRQAAWTRFAAVRSSYDKALRGLAGLTLGAPAPWTTDRPAVVGRPRLLTNRPISVDWTVSVSPPSPRADPWEGRSPPSR